MSADNDIGQLSYRDRLALRIGRALVELSKQPKAASARRRRRKRRDGEKPKLISPDTS